MDVVGQQAAAEAHDEQPPALDPQEEAMMRMITAMDQPSSGDNATALLKQARSADVEVAAAEVSLADLERGAITTVPLRAPRGRKFFPDSFAAMAHMDFPAAAQAPSAAASTFEALEVAVVLATGDGGFEAARRDKPDVVGAAELRGRSLEERPSLKRSPSLRRASRTVANAQLALSPSLSPPAPGKRSLPSLRRKSNAADAE